MDKLECVAIVGVGLIGGSIGLALRRRQLARRVIGIGRRQSSLRIARRLGAVTHTTIDLAKGVADAELVIVCLPVAKIVDHVRRAAEHAAQDTLITDAGSTKRAIVNALDRALPRNCHFLGGHPLAGSDQGGPAHATADLFEGRAAILTPTRRSRDEDCRRLEQLWSAMGSIVVRMSAAEHDRALAVTSHLPHAVAVALAASLPARYCRLTGTGFLDTTRIAGGPPELWSQIFATNRRNVARALSRFEERVAELRAAIENDEPGRLERILNTAKKKRDALGS